MMNAIDKTFPIPFIGPQDYLRFRSIMGSALPGSYDEWLAKHAIQKHTLDRLGYDVQEVQVEPDELIRYGNSYGRTPTMPMLGLIAFDKVRGRAW